MASFHEYIAEYRAQLEKGTVQKAYRGLMEYIMELRTIFQNKYPGYFVSGSIYYGYMDMTYFSFTPKSIKDRGLKIALVFIHDRFCFEAWLAGANRQIQKKYWDLLKESAWDKYHLVPAAKGVDAILEHVVADNPDFSNLDELTGQIDRETSKFICDVEDFLANRPI
jgi:hypothetical protein